jgi:hypothetical protein
MHTRGTISESLARVNLVVVGDPGRQLTHHGLGIGSGTDTDVVAFDRADEGFRSTQPAWRSSSMNLHHSVDPLARSVRCDVGISSRHAESCGSVGAFFLNVCHSVSLTIWLSTAVCRESRPWGGFACVWSGRPLAGCALQNGGGLVFDHAPGDPSQYQHAHGCEAKLRCMRTSERDGQAKQHSREHVHRRPHQRRQDIGHIELTGWHSQHASQQGDKRRAQLL